MMIGWAGLWDSLWLVGSAVWERAGSGWSCLLASSAGSGVSPGTHFLFEREGKKWKWKWGEKTVMSASALAVRRVLRSEGKGAFGSDAVTDWFSSETARSSHHLSTCIWNQQPQHTKHNPLRPNSKTLTHKCTTTQTHTWVNRSAYGKEKEEPLKLNSSLIENKLVSHCMHCINWF